MENSTPINLKKVSVEKSDNGTNPVTATNPVASMTNSPLTPTLLSETERIRVRGELDLRGNSQRNNRQAGPHLPLSFLVPFLTEPNSRTLGPTPYLNVLFKNGRDIGRLRKPNINQLGLPNLQNQSCAVAIHDQDEKNLEGPVLVQDGQVWTQDKQSFERPIQAQYRPRFTIRAQDRQSYSNKTEEKPSVSIKAEEKPSVSIKAEEKPSVSIKAEEKASVFIKAEEKPSVSIKAEEKASVSIKAEEKPMFTIRALDKPRFTITALDEPRFTIRALDEPRFSIRALDDPRFTIRALDAPRLTIKDQDKLRRTQDRPSFNDLIKEQEGDTNSSHLHKNIPDCEKTLHDVEVGKSKPAKSVTSTTSRRRPQSNDGSRNKDPLFRKKQWKCVCINCTNKIRRQREGSARLHVCHVPGCDKTYKKTSHLKSHLDWHKGYRPYACEFKCGKTFFRTDEMKRHMLAHTEVKPFICHFCQKAFARSDHCNKHIAIHTRANPARPRERKKKPIMFHETTAHTLDEVQDVAMDLTLPKKA